MVQIAVERRGSGGWEELASRSASAPQAANGPTTPDAAQLRSIYP